MIRYVLFDLDGTLLPMDQEVFIKAYFGGISARLAAHGYDPKKLIESIWLGTKAMIQNDGSKTNEEAFWSVMETIYGDGVRDDEPKFDAFYREEFDKVRASCGFHPKSAEIVAFLKEKNVGVALATNPIFPRIATRKRAAWAGLQAEDFALVTTYENSRHAKPNPAYYQDILDFLGVSGEECIMVGNDVSEDMVAEKLGMRVFLLTDCLINKYGAELSQYPHGGFDELRAYLAESIEG